MNQKSHELYLQIISKIFLNPKSYDILKEFLDILDKFGFEYEINEGLGLIKLKGIMNKSIINDFPSIYFNQDKGKKIHIIHMGNYIEIQIFTNKKRTPIKIYIPKSWKIEYENSYLYIFFN